jgi:hypothetical protein
MPLPVNLAYEFMGMFARCEYALKCSDFARGGTHSVEADWDTFSRTIDWHFRRIKDDELKAATNLLLKEPPRKQVLRDGRVTWKDSPPDSNLPKAEQVLLMVRRIRNNLFHGAKVWSPEYGNRERDVSLVSAALVVLKHCILLNTNVHLAYEIGVF